MALEKEVADLRTAVTTLTKSNELLMQVMGELTHAIGSATLAGAQAVQTLSAEDTEVITKTETPKVDDKPKKPTDDEVKNHDWFKSITAAAVALQATAKELDGSDGKAPVIEVLKRHNDKGQIKGIVTDSIVMGSSVLVDKALEDLVATKNALQDQIDAKKAETSSTAADEPSDFGDPEVEEVAEVTVDDLRAALRAYAAEHSQAEAIKVMEATAGVKTAAGVPKDKMGELMKALKV